MRTRVLAVSLALILSLGLLSGCENDNYSESQRVVCEVELANAGSPVIAPFWQDGGDGIFGPDPVTGENDDVRVVEVVPFIFRARPYSFDTMTIPEDDVFSSFIITGYNVIWEPANNAPAGLDMTPYNITNGAFSLQVPIEEDATSAILITDLPTKDYLAAVLGADAVTPWPTTSDFTANARIQFIGHASGTKHETVIDTGVYVNFTYFVGTD